MAHTDERGFLHALEEAPKDVATHLAYADWLEEHGRSYEALKQRVEAGVSQAQYKLRRKSDGLFSEGGGKDVQWTITGRSWPGLVHLRGHLISGAGRGSYGNNTPWADLEVVVLELRVQPLAILPVSVQIQGPYHKRSITIPEPQGAPGA